MHAAILMLLVSGIPAPPALAQTDSIIRYENGRLVSERVPYHRVFRITGSRQTAHGPADAVQVRISRRGDQAAMLLKPWTWAGVFGTSTAQPVDSACWVAPDSNPPKDFSIALGPLKLGQPYSFEMTFYAGAQPVDVTDAARLAVADMARLYESRKSITSAEVDDIIKARMDEVVNRLGGKVVYLDKTVAGQCIATSVRPPIPLSDAQRTLLREAAQNTVLQQPAIRRFDEGLAALNPLVPRIPPLVEQLRREKGREQDRIDSLNRRHAAGKGPAPPGPALVYTNDDLAALLQIARAVDTIGSPVIMDENGWNRLEAATMAGSPLPAATKALLVDVLDAILRLRTGNTEYRKHSAGLAALPTIKARLTNGYFSLAKTAIEAVPWSTDAEVKKLQVGTGYGGGFAYLDVGKNASDDGFGFLVLKFYAGAVDKSLPNPWSSRTARWAFNLGAVSKSTISYRGQAQADALGSLKPLVGFSYDLQRRIGLHGGALVFRQPSVNPLATERRRLRAAPFLGLAFDFDALNELATAIGGSHE